jgi:cyclopropane fatty-acyl-phospholipid synthase-like methyltransferase
MGPASNDPDERFSERYAASGAAAAIEAELEVLGTDYQANGYSTRAQVDEIGIRLGLRAGERLLDLGSGCGYPGLYLAKRHWCSVATVDPVASGVVVGVERARRDGIDDRHLAVIGTGAALPFRSESFDAIVHVDVMC